MVGPPEHVGVPCFGGHVVVRHAAGRPLAHRAVQVHLDGVGPRHLLHLHRGASMPPVSMAVGMTKRDRTIGVVGVGRMGANIGRRLKEVGYEIAAVHDARAETAAELATELGAHPALTPREVADRADLVITVVTDDASMREIYDRSDGS